MSKERISRSFGHTGLRSIALAMGFVAASSSCSYAAAGRSALAQGAALVPMLAFMFASTNLVIEPGAVLWLLMGWRFVLAEVTGAFFLIAIMWLLVRLFVPKSLENEVRAQANRARVTPAMSTIMAAPSPENCRNWPPPSSWIGRCCGRKIIIGFLIAGLLAGFIPTTWWRALFLESGPAPVRLIENAIVGPIIAIGSFRVLSG